MDEQIFSGIARYYSLYRPRYPEELLRGLVDLSVGDKGRSMVDWGCGTGEVALPLSVHFDSVTAVDIDPAMVAVAQEKASQQGVANVRWIVGPAEDLELDDASQDLIVAGSSFHWMDRDLLSRRAFSALAERGAIAIIGGGSDVWDLKCDWHEVAVRVMRQWLGDQRRAGGATYTVKNKHGDFLEPAGFTLESRRYRVEQNWSIDAIVGYLYSTSFANPALFGDHLSDFEADLRAELAKLSPDDSYPELLDFYVMFGRKQSG